MKTRSKSLALGLALCTCSTFQSAQAVSTITQTFSFTENVSIWEDAPDQIHYYYFPASYQTDVNPFNTTLGVLESVTLRWTFAASFEGFASSDPSGGSVSLSVNGSFFIDGSSYDGAGAGGGHGSAANGPISMTSSPTWNAKEFTAAQAGISYNPANWTALSGNQPWSAEFVFNTGQLSYNDLASGTLTSDLGLEVTYTYSPVPEPSGVLGSIALLSGGMFFRRRKLAA